MKLGKLPARKDAVTFKLNKFLDFKALPAPPKKGGHRELVNAWQMFGNDMYGDCVCAGALHETILWNKEAGVDVPFTTVNALQLYSAITGFNPNDPATDNGTDMQAAASYRRKIGVRDQNGHPHKVAAYLGISAGNVDQLKQAIYRFGAAGIGFEFPDYAMDQFNEGKSWHLQSGGHIEGGHYVAAVGYDWRYVYVVSWGRLQKMSWGFYKKYCDEAVAYVSEEMLIKGLSLEGFNFQELQQSLSQL